MYSKHLRRAWYFVFKLVPETSGAVPQAMRACEEGSMGSMGVESLTTSVLEPLTQRG
jgi:hypothetical protein